MNRERELSRKRAFLRQIDDDARDFFDERRYFLSFFFQQEGHVNHVNHEPTKFNLPYSAVLK